MAEGYPNLHNGKFNLPPKIATEKCISLLDALSGKVVIRSGREYAPELNPEPWIMPPSPQMARPSEAARFPMKRGLSQYSLFVPIKMRREEARSND